MPICQYCHQKWTWKQTMRKVFGNINGMPCPFCGHTQYITAASKKKSSYYGFIIPVLIPVQILLEVPILPMIAIFIIVSTIVIGCYPYVIKLSNKQESF